MRTLTILFLMCFFTNSWAISYRQISDRNGDVRTDTIQRIDDSAFIPTDPLNSDYLEFIDWVKKGNKISPPLTLDPPDSVKEQAKIDLNTRSKTDTERIDAIIKYLDLDK